MYNAFFVRKSDDTYANLLEAYGLANLIKDIDRSIFVDFQDEGYQMKLTLNKPITKEMLTKKDYFQVVKFILNKPKTTKPKNIGKNLFDYPAQRDFRKAKREEVDKLYKDKELRKDEAAFDKRLKEVNQKYQNNPEIKWEEEYDIYSQMISNPYSSFTKLYNNFALNKEHFFLLLETVLESYANPKFEYNLKKNKELNLTHDISQLQLFNPSKGSGLNKAKANGLGSSNIKTNWISEILKISGALNSMLCQSVKVGTTYDLKVFVPEFSLMTQSQKSRLVSLFKAQTKSYSPIKLDILNLLKLLQTFIKYDENYNKGKLKYAVRGLHSVYQKDLGNNKAVTNIAFIHTPEFIEIGDRKSGNEWKKILAEHQEIIEGIEERGDAIQGLLAYRNFFSGSDIDSFFKFIFWYASYVSHEISKKNYYVKPFKTDSLTQLFEFISITLNHKLENMKFKEIIENEGFKSIAEAIRKSTISLMYTPKGKRAFNVKYGFARQLQNNSKTNEELVTFISDFAATFNTERARKSEISVGKAEDIQMSFRQKTIRENELTAFYELVDSVDDAKMLGAMLAAYGFSLLEKKDDNPENA